MKPLIVVVCLISFLSCSASHEIPDLTIPELISRVPLPVYPHPTVNDNLRLELNLLIGEDGTVRYVDFIRGSGDVEWDSIAMASIKRWKYSPAVYQGKPMRLWLHQTAIVSFSRPEFLTLAELLCPTKEEADSVYKKLSEGCDFCELVLLHSVAPSREKRGSVGTVNIQQFPDDIRQILSRLDVNEWTEPMQYGTWFAIFKRIPEQ